MMIICKTPFRISFLGGGTDLLPWIKYSGKGHVISTTINKYGYIFFREINNLQNYNYKIRYYLNETTKNIHKIKHPVVKYGLLYYKIKNKKIHITYDGELPSRTGLGTSSSFTVGFINSIYCFKNKNINKLDLAKQAINFEHKILKEYSGLQDQIAASYGGLNHIQFKPDSFKVKKLKLSKEKIKILNNSMFLCLVPGSRNSTDIEKNKIKNIYKNRNIYNEIFEITKEGLNELNSRSSDWFDNFNFYINEYWKLKKRLNKNVSNQSIDNLCQSFIKDGAYSAKLLGAGSNGFISVMADDLVKKRLLKKYKKFKFINVTTEDFGSKIYKL